MSGTVKKMIPVKDLAFCALFAALTAAGAFLRIPVPYVPFTLQFLFTNLAGLLLGSKRGFISICLYIFIGLTGIPVFAQGGGPAYVLQPSFGYIAGFALGTFLTGLIAERGEIGVKRYILAGFAGFAAVFALGLVYFYLIATFCLEKPLGVWETFVTGFLLFAPGDILIVVAGAIIALRLRPFLPGGKTAGRTPVRRGKGSWNSPIGKKAK
ncbi:MAG: biotin transporter BioY [Oscillospiraceae bacterium]|jgi:biotin transport system substrate-specific component|nr:biotin transporter BioY [Oscillospiraceae bacterium]